MSLVELAKKIKISSEDVKNVQPAVENILRNLDGVSYSKYFPPIMEKRFIGSYDRNTKIKPLDDIDLLVLMGIGNHVSNNWHTLTDCSFVFPDSYLDSDTNISSVNLLNILKSLLVQAYPRSEIRRNNEVVNVYLSSYDLGFDIIPAFYYRNVDYYLIPQGGGGTKWKKTNPLKDKTILDRFNANNNYQLKDAIIILKHWFEYKKIKKLRSYHLESFVYHLFDGEAKQQPTIRECLLFIFWNIEYNNYIRKCPDPTGLSEDLSSGLVDDDINKIYAEAKNAYSILSRNEQEFIEYVGE